MNSQFMPLLNKRYIFKKHSLLFLGSGYGAFQVDFRNYTFSEGRVIFLAPGQYFQLLSGNFIMLLYEFPEADIQRFKNARYLFKHIVSLGHIDIEIPTNPRNPPLEYFSFGEDNNAILRKAIDEWIAFNPFQSSLQDINLLFDLKDIIDQKFGDRVDLKYISRRLQEKPYRINLLTKEKLQHTVNMLSVEKILLEAKRRIVFTDLSVKEIAYETGFKDPDYFNRFFRKQTDMTPLGFRETYDFEERDSFLRDLTGLIGEHFREEHFAGFYAEKFSITTKALSKKISVKLSTSFSQLISNKLLQEARLLLQQKMPVNVIAFNLGFKEPNHFSAFFKNKTGKTPTQFLNDL